MWEIKETGYDAIGIIGGRKSMSVLSNIRRAINLEGSEIQSLSDQIGPDYEVAVRMLANCQGRAVVTGVGKSGHIGRKIASSFASMGAPSFFVHSTEGVHGDLGMIREEDVILLISNSGETKELLNLLPSLKKIGAKRIVITSNENSTLAKMSHVALIYHYDKEADHLDLAPTISSTLALVIGDALAVALSAEKGFSKENFHLYHPGGALGSQLLEERKSC